MPGTYWVAAHEDDTPATPSSVPSGAVTKSGPPVAAARDFSLIVRRDRDGVFISAGRVEQTAAIEIVDLRLNRVAVRVQVGKLEEPTAEFGDTARSASLRYELGLLIGGREGRELIAQGRSAIAAEHVVDPDRMMAVYTCDLAGTA